MIFTETKLKGAYLVEPVRSEDSRGFFARVWCCREFEEHGLNARLVQCNISFNAQKGTLRGMHFQKPPCEEVKLVRCTAGAIHDVIIDLRPGSPTFLQHVSAVLTAENRKTLYIPVGFAHGFLTLEDNTEVFYQMSEFYSPAQGCGVRWNDPAFGIRWPSEVKVVSEKDSKHPDFVAVR